MQNELHERMYGDQYGSRTGQTEYRDMTTATDLAKNIASDAETPAQRRERWAHMTPSQIIRSTPIADLQKFARRGAEMAIAELKRRDAKMTRAVQIPRPDPPLDIGV